MSKVFLHHLLHGITHSHTFVRKLENSMKLQLTSEQIFSLRVALRGLGLMKDLETVCAELEIASRDTVYKAVTAGKYRSDLVTHRAVVAEAIELVRNWGGNLGFLNQSEETIQLVQREAA